MQFSVQIRSLEKENQRKRRLKSLVTGPGHEEAQQSCKEHHKNQESGLVARGAVEMKEGPCITIACCMAMFVWIEGVFLLNDGCQLCSNLAAWTTMRCFLEVKS